MRILCIAAFLAAFFMAPATQAQMLLRDYRHVEGSRLDSLVVFDGCPDGIGLQCLGWVVELPLTGLTGGEVVRIDARICADNNDLRSVGKNVNWVNYLVIEPVEGNNWWNYLPDGPDFLVDFGHVSMRQNGNLTAEMHHECREFSTTWETPPDVADYQTWWAKLLSRASSGAAESGDRLNIQAGGRQVQLEAWVWR